MERRAFLTLHDIRHSLVHSFISNEAVAGNNGILIIFAVYGEEDSGVHIQGKERKYSGETSSEQGKLL